MTMTAVAPLDPDALTMDAIRDGALRDRAVTVLGFARSGIALARFLTDAGARVTIYDGRPESELTGAVAALDGRTVRLLLGPAIDPAAALGRGRARDDVALDQPGLPDDRAATAGRPARASSTRARRATEPSPPSSPSRTCSCGSARRRRSG